MTDSDLIGSILTKAHCIVHGHTYGPWRHWSAGFPASISASLNCDDGTLVRDCEHCGQRQRTTEWDSLEDAGQ